MRKLSALSALLGVLLAAPAFAIPFQITVQGQLTIGNESTNPLPVFGITDISVPVQISFTLDSADATMITAGTPLTGTGATFSSNLQLFSASALSNFVANIGNASFESSELRPLPLGSLSSHSMMLVGNMAEHGISAAYFSMLDPVAGDITFGSFSCIVSCAYSNTGHASDYISSGMGLLSSIQVFAQELTPPPDEEPAEVPEPSTLALFGLGLALTLVSKRTRPSAIDR